MAKRLPPNSVRLYTSDTPRGLDLYPTSHGERFSRVQTAAWDRRVVTGPVSADAEQLISSWTQDDYSGGFGIKDGNESTDVARIAFGVIDGRRPKSMCLPPLTSDMGAPWTPDQLGSGVLRAWFKADAITGLSDGVTLSSGWNDSSGNARHAANVTDADRPLYQTSDLNSLPGVEFVSTDDLATTLTASSHDETLMAVIDVDSIAAVRTIVGDQATTGRALQVETTGAISIAKTGTGALGTSTATISINTPAIVGATTGATTVITHVNGVDETDNHAVTFAASQSSSLGTANGTSNPFDGMLYEVVACSTLSTANREKLEGYLAHKWGLTGNLASDHPYKTVAPTATAGVGAAYPLGDVGTQFYVGWDTGIVGWNHTSSVWYPYVNHWPASFEPVGEAVMFCGGLFVPGGAQGFVRLSESVAATGALTVAQLTSITAVEFGLHDGKLWAIDTANHLWQLTTVGAAAGATTLGNWTEVGDALGNDLILDTSLTPTQLLNWFNAAQEETLWCLTQGQGAYLFNPDEPRWIKSTVREGAHPDWGIAAEVFRDGEDLMIAAGGLDITRFTTGNVEVPLSGPSKDQGVPPEYHGTIKDLCSERSTLYALIQAGTSVAAGSPATEWVLQDTFGVPGSTTEPLAFDAPGQVAVDSNGRVIIADTNNDRIMVLTSAGVFAASQALTGVTGVAVDSSNNIYAASTTGSDVRLAKYSSALVQSWSQVLTTSGAPGHVAVDATYVYVTDTTNDVIYKRLITTGSQWVLQNTYGPTYNSLAMSSPSQVALNAAGTRVYIADTGNDRLVVTDGSGSYVDSITTGLEDITGVCVDSSGNIYTLSESATEIRLRQYNSSLVQQWAVTFGDDGGQGHVTTDGTHVWACDSVNRKVWKRLCTDGSAVSSFGSLGSSNGLFGADGPYGIANDGTHLYVSDISNSRVQKFLMSSGAYVTHWGEFGVSGVAIDASGDVLVARFTLGDVRRRTNTGTFIDSFTQAAATGIGVASGDVLWITNTTAGTIAVWDELSTATIGSSGTGNGQFDTPKGIDTDGTHLWVVDSGNARAQKITVGGAYVAQWAINTGARGLALDASGDVWIAERSNNQLRRFSDVGVLQDTIAQTTPNALGVSSADILWVSTGQSTIAQWDEESVSSEAVAAKTWLGAWTGTAWCALWDSSTAMTPTWMRVSMKGDYALWWGNTDGALFRQLIPPPFFNPADRVTLGEYPFAATGWMDTFRFDGQMSGWDKIASHAFAMMEYAAADVYVDVSYRTDADQFDSGDIDPPYRPWKRIDHIGRTILWFDDTDIDPTSGLPWHEGEPFQWIQFRFEFARGTDTFKSPIWMWHSCHYTAIPQDSASITLKIPLNFDRDVYRRNPDEMAQTLRALQTSRSMVHLQISNPRPGNPDFQVFFRGRVIKVNSEFNPGADNNTDEVMVVNFIEVGASSNAHTTTATDTP